MNSEDENWVSDDLEPEWKLLTPEEVDRVKLFLILARRNHMRLKGRWKKEFARSIEEMIQTSNGEVRLSIKQLAIISKLHAELEVPKGKPDRIAIASAALEILEQEVSRIETEIELLSKLRIHRIKQVKEKLSEAQGKWVLKDFADPLMKAYQNLPNIPVEELLSLFDPNLKRITQIPREYRQLPTGEECGICGNEIYVYSRSATFKTAVNPQTGQHVRVCETCHYQQEIVIEYDGKGGAKKYQGSKLIKTYSEYSVGSALDDDYRPVFSKPDSPADYKGSSLYKRQQKLLQMSYKDYLQSPEWLDIRRKAYIRAGYKCQVCAKEGKLNVHHNNYPTRGTETPRDLLVMCEPCHQKFHNVMPKLDDNEIS